MLVLPSWQKVVRGKIKAADYYGEIDLSDTQDKMH
jgi:hypothetical protein